jgi:hypothetical protein
MFAKHWKTQSDGYGVDWETALQLRTYVPGGRSIVTGVMDAALGSTMEMSGPETVVAREPPDETQIGPAEIKFFPVMEMREYRSTRISTVVRSLFSFRQAP